jgi:hypothetical protein
MSSCRAEEARISEEKWSQGFGSICMLSRWLAKQLKPLSNSNQKQKTLNTHPTKIICEWVGGWVCGSFFFKWVLWWSYQQWCFYKIQWGTWDGKEQTKHVRRSNVLKKKGEFGCHGYKLTNLPPHGCCKFGAMWAMFRIG